MTALAREDDTNLSFKIGREHCSPVRVCSVAMHLHTAFTTDMIGFNSQRGLADDASKVCAEVQAGQGGDPHKTRSPARKLGKRGACHKKI